MNLHLAFANFLAFAILFGSGVAIVVLAIREHREYRRTQREEDDLFGIRSPFSRSKRSRS